MHFSDKRHYEKFANGSVKDIEDEIPFEVPEGWSWCRLSLLCEYKKIFTRKQSFKIKVYYEIYKY